MQQLAGNYVERTGKVVFLVCTRRHHLKLSAFLHPLVADLRKQLDVEFVSKQQELFRAKMLEYAPNPRQFIDALPVIVFSGELGALPDPSYFMQPAAQGISRSLNAAIDLELGSKCCTTPTSATPAKGFRRLTKQGQKRASERGRQTSRAKRRLNCAIAGKVKAKRVVTIGSNNPVDGRARAEQEGSNLSGSAARSTKQQDVKGEQVAVAGAPELRKRLLLLRERDVKYGRIWHSLYSKKNRVFRNNRFIKEFLSVPIS